MTRLEGLRAPPHSIDSEQAVIGGLLLNENALARIADFLSEADFYCKDHRMIFRAISDLAAQGKPYDAVTLGEWFESNGLAELVGGSDYVLQLANSTPSAANITAYAEIVREKARLRALIDAGTAIAQQAWAPKADASLIATEATNALSGLLGDVRAGGPHSVRTAVKSWFAQLHERYSRGDKMSGLPLPWAVLNDAMLGLQDGDLIIIAGRTSMGKTVAGAQVGFSNALAGNRTLIFSLEMREEQLVQRAVAAHARVSHEALRSPQKLDDADWPRITEATSRIVAAPLEIDDQPALTVAQIVARAKRSHLRMPLKLIVIDHLHEIKRLGRDPVNELAEIARALRALGKQLGIPVVLLAQLNRASASRADHRPTLADLRASGAIEEIGDVILLLHREDYYDKSTHLKGVVEVILAKGRDLPAGEGVYLQNRFDQMRLDDWDGPLPTANLPQQSGWRGRGASHSVVVTPQRAPRGVAGCAP